MMGWSEIAAVIAELAKLCQLIFARTNSPDMVKSAIDNIRQNIADQTAKLDQQFQQPNLSPADHQKLVDQLRLEQS